MTQRSLGEPASGRRQLDELLVRAGRGDRSAFASVYDSVAPLVYGIALRVVRDPARAEEVSQDAFLEIWRHAPRFDPERGSAKAWICTIAHRRAVDVVRSEQARRDREAGDAAAAATVDHANPADLVETAFEQEGVRKALESLTDVQRQALRLAFYEGHTYREVATMLGAPLGTVKTRMRDGLARLAQALGASGG